MSCRPRLRAPPRALLLLAARGRAEGSRDLAKLAEAERSRRWRSPTRTTSSARSNFPRSSPAKGIQPIAGIQLSVASRSRSRTRAAPAAADRPTSCFSRTPDGATSTSCGSRAGPISTCRSAIRRGSPLATLARACRGTDRADRRSIGPARHGLARRAAERARRPRGSTSSPALSATGSTSRSSATASTTSGAVEAELIALADRAGLPLVATNEPFFAARRRLRGARRAARHRGGPARLRRRAPAADAASTASRRAPRWPALFADLPDALAATRRDRHALRLPGARRASRSCRASARGAAGPTRGGRRGGRARAGRREEGLRARLAAHGPAPGLDGAGSTASGSTSSSTSSAG